MIKLSTIVPIYGVEQYLRKCVDSLLNQDVPASEYEIILVDDGSPDECPQICDEYARMSQESRVKSQELPCIRVIHRKNGGLSAARNAGIKAAKGKYIMFVDSDDYIEPNVLGGLLTQVEREQLDVLRYDFQNVRLRSERVNELTNERDYEVFKPNKAQKRDVDLSEEVTDGETFLNERLGPGCYACQFIIKRDLIYNDGMSRGESINESLSLNDVCLFQEGIYFEDVDWTPRMLVRAKRVASTKTVVYNYLWRTGSITLPDNLQKREKVIQDKIALIRGYKDQQKFVKNPQWFIWMTSNTAMGILTFIAGFSNPERNKYISELKQMQIFPLYTKKEKMLTHKIKIILANISPSLYCTIMSLRK